MQTFLWLWLQHKKVCYLLTGLLSPADCVHITYMIYIHLHVRDHKILCKIMKCKNWVEMICLSVTMHSSCCQHKAKTIHLNCWCLPLSQSRLTETQGKKRVWPVGRENRGRMDGKVTVRPTPRGSALRGRSRTAGCGTPQQSAWRRARARLPDL